MSVQNPGEGHNSALDGTAQEKVRSYVRRALNLENDADAIKEDLKELYSEAKGDGFDPAILRKVVARARKDKAKLDEEEALIALYEGAVQGDLFASDETKVTVSVRDEDGGDRVIMDTTARGLQAAADNASRWAS